MRRTVFKKKEGAFEKNADLFSLLCFLSYCAFEERQRRRKRREEEEKREEQK